MPASRDGFHRQRPAVDSRVGHPVVVEGCLRVDHLGSRTRPTVVLPTSHRCIRAPDHWVLVVSAVEVGGCSPDQDPRDHPVQTDWQHHDAVSDPPESVRKD